MVCSAKYREIEIWDWKKNLPIKLQQVIKKGLFTQRHSIEKYLHKPQTKMGSALVLILFGLVIATSQVSAQVAWGSGQATKLIFPRLYCKNHLFAWMANQWPLDRKHYFFLSFSNSLVLVSDPWRAFWADTAPFKGPQPRRVYWFRTTEIQGHRQVLRLTRRSQDTVQNNWRKPWVCVCWKRTFLHWSVIVNRIELS